MYSESSNEDSQNGPVNEADSDQLDGQNHPDEMGEEELMHSAKNAQSITDSDSQTRQQNNDQAIQHNSYSVDVVASKREEEKEILVSLGNFGIAYPKAKELIDKHGSRRVEEVIEHAKDQNCKNVAGYIIRALQEKWTLALKSAAENYAEGDGSAYITGKYAAFILQSSGYIRKSLGVLAAY